MHQHSTAKDTTIPESSSSLLKFFEYLAYLNGIFKEESHLQLQIIHLDLNQLASEMKTALFSLLEQVIKKPNLIRIIINYDVNKELIDLIEKQYWEQNLSEKVALTYLKESYSDLEKTQSQTNSLFIPQGLNNLPQEIKNCMLQMFILSIPNHELKELVVMYEENAEFLSIITEKRAELLKRMNITFIPRGYPLEKENALNLNSAEHSEHVEIQKEKRKRDTLENENKETISSSYSNQEIVVTQKQQSQLQTDSTHKSKKRRTVPPSPNKTLAHEQLPSLEDIGDDSTKASGLETLPSFMRGGKKLPVLQQETNLPLISSQSIQAPGSFSASKTSAFHQPSNAQQFGNPLRTILPKEPNPTPFKGSFFFNERGELTPAQESTQPLPTRTPNYHHLSISPSKPGFTSEKSFYPNSSGN